MNKKQYAHKVSDDDKGYEDEMWAMVQTLTRATGQKYFRNRARQGGYLGDLTPEKTTIPPHTVRVPRRHWLIRILSGYQPTPLGALRQSAVTST